jgi:hypothetical protein
LRQKARTYMVPVVPVIIKFEKYNSSL